MKMSSHLAASVAADYSWVDEGTACMGPDSEGCKGWTRGCSGETCCQDPSAGTAPGALNHPFHIKAGFLCACMSVCFLQYRNYDRTECMQKYTPNIHTHIETLDPLNMSPGK